MLFRSSLGGRAMATVVAVLVASMASAEPPVPALVVMPGTPISVSGPSGGPFLPSSFQYQVSASKGELRFSIGAPSWLTAEPRTGLSDTRGVTITFVVNATATNLRPGSYGPAVSFTNVSNGRGSTARPVRLNVTPRAASVSSSTKPTGYYLMDDRGGYLLDDRGERLRAQ
jgi:hypothetical protein